MHETTDHTAGRLAALSVPGRDRRILVFWVLAICLLAGGAWLCHRIVLPVLQVFHVGRAVQHVPDEYGPDYDQACVRAIKGLGGEQAAAEKLSSYLSLPGWATAEKRQATYLLCATGEAGIPFLIRHMEHPSMEVKSAILWNMSKGHPAARRVVPHLARMALEPNATCAYSAILALGGVGAEAAEAVPELIKCLGHADPGRRRYAARALGLIGDTRAVEPLRAVLNDQDELVREEAQEALAVRRVI